MKHAGTRAARCLLALTILTTLIGTGYVRTVSAEVNGTVYTSPNFGYSITWQSPWYVTEDDKDGNGFDILGLADDQSFVYFSGGQSSATSPKEVIDDYAGQLASAQDITGLTPMDASQCPVTPPPDSAVACYSATQNYSDGSTEPIGVFLQGWDLGNKIDLLLEAYVPQAAFQSYLPKFQTFGIYPPGQIAPTPAAGGCDATVEQGVDFCFDSDLSEQYRSDVTEAIRLGQDVIAQYFGNPDMSGVRINGFESASTSGGDESLATTVGHSIAVYAGSDVWQSIPPLERTETLVHEFFHVYQNLMTEDVDPVVPLWFTEGSAEAVGFLAVSQLGISDQTEIYDMEAYSLTEYPVPTHLPDLDQGGSMSADAYPMAYIAVQYLLGSKGDSVSAIGDLYTQLQQGASFEQAFQTVFGESVDQFYADFEAWFPTFQQEDQLPSDFWPNDGSGQPAAVTPVHVPQAATRDEQLVIVADTGSLTNCDATLQLGQSSLQRDTYANGSGEVFWLLTIPEDAPTGPATLTLSCGAAPVTQQIAIS